MNEQTDAYVVPLGVVGALPDAEHHNTYLAVVRNARFWMVDCAGSPITQLDRAGLDPMNIQGVIITHFHPDHVYGLPALLLGLFVKGIAETRPRQEALSIYARPEVLWQVRALVELFDYQDWVWALPIEYHPIVTEIGAPVDEDELFTITATPSRHSIPSMAVRFDTRHRDSAFVYSSDTLPCFEVEELARGAMLLFHESGGSGHGHSMPKDVAALAMRAKVERLALIHYAAGQAAQAQILEEALAAFNGPVELAEELKCYYF
jgi:ribonuclease Z